MKAVVLVGGEGTRLRPLTHTIPKPLVPLVDRPFLHHVLEHLSRHGVREVVLSSPYLGEAFERFLRDRTSRAPVVTWITEAMPLGTGGAVANAARLLDDTFLVLNGDILTDLDLTALIRAHGDRAAAATIALARVEDARPYGLVVRDAGGRVLEFREKPSEPVGGWVNAGTYVLEPGVLGDIPADRAVSIEREVFPSLIAAGEPVHGHESRAYWMDLGTVEKYLRATFDALEGRVDGLAYAAPHVDPLASVSLRAQLGRWVVVGPGARVEDGAELEDSVVLAGAVVEAGARVRESVVGPRATVGRGAIVQGAVLAEEGAVPDDAVAEGARVGPGERFQSVPGGSGLDRA